jgi:hypothetical protein
MHNAGFFSCCSVKLHQIADFIMAYKNLPYLIDSSHTFNWYKTTHGDITYDYFEHYDNIQSNIKTPAKFTHCDQCIDYSTLDYNIIPIIEKYFTPSKQIKEIIQTMETKYNIDYNNICVLFYRGNDKNRETKICEYSDYLIYANSILKENPNIKFLIQSDETEFIEYMTNDFPNSFYFKDEIRHMNKCNSTVDIVMQHANNLFSKYYLAITIIMSKCKYIICGSGNCSLWIIFYRGNNNNVYQNLEGKWYDTVNIPIQMSNTTSKTQSNFIQSFFNT